MIQRDEKVLLFVVNFFVLAQKGSKRNAPRRKSKQLALKRLDLARKLSVWRGWLYCASEIMMRNVDVLRWESSTRHTKQDKLHEPPTNRTSKDRQIVGQQCSYLDTRVMATKRFQLSGPLDYVLCVRQQSRTQLYVLVLPRLAVDSCWRLLHEPPRSYTWGWLERHLYVSIHTWAYRLFQDSTILP